MRMRRSVLSQRAGVSLLCALLGVGCSEHLTEELVEQAASDLHCDESAVRVLELQPDAQESPNGLETPFTATVFACGREARYHCAQRRGRLSASSACDRL
jgi:hypothetical protein